MRLKKKLKRVTIWKKNKGIEIPVGQTQLVEEKEDDTDIPKE